MAPRPSAPAIRSDRLDKQELRVFLVAGEASGDALGSALMSALAELSERPIRYRGVGGPAMTAKGLQSLFDYSELSVMGLLEVLPHLPRLLWRMRQVARDIEIDPPDVLITIDSPGFVFGVIRRLRGRAFPRIHYVAPTVWAWRPRRVHKFRRHFDHLMVLFPFEPEYFERVGLPCTFVGHPLTEAARKSETDVQNFRSAHGVPSKAPLLCVLPGSRSGEIDRHAGSFGATVRRLAMTYTDLHVTIPTLPHLEDRIAAETAAWPVPSFIVTENGQRAAAMAAADIALAASGTVTLELARERVPTVVAYRVTPLTAWLVRRLVKIRFVSIVNLIAGREVVPEFLQRDMQPDAMAHALESMLSDPVRRQAMKVAQDEAMHALGEGGMPPSRRAAAVVLDVLCDWRKT